MNWKTPQKGKSVPRLLSMIVVKHRAARFVFGDYSNFSHVTPMLKQLGWDTLEQCRLSYQLSIFYKIQQGLVVISLPSEVCPLTSRLLEPPMYSLFVTFSPVVTFIVAWNKLPVTTNIFPFTNGIMLSMIRCGLL